MKKMFFLAPVMTALFLVAPAPNAQAQSQAETPKYEVGVNYTLLRTNGAGLVNSTSDSGVGGRVTYNLANSLSVEGEYNFFPQDGRVNLANLIGINSHKSEGLFGVKYGMRSEKWGIFGKLRPGFVRFSEGTPAGLGSNTNFALDVGGVLEYYLARSISVRVDLGDTIIRYPDNPTFGIGSFTTNNLQLGTGVSFRF
ncbi:MAG: porin family protein [Chloracidobacterium sp.]|nr:porin family protein [Chloracidobacterium sp.]